MANEPKEYKSKVKSSEEVRYYRGDRANVIDFRVATTEAQEELKAMVKKLYTSLKDFQDLYTQLLAMVEKVKIKNTELEGVRLSMDNLKKWSKENLDAPQDIPRITEKENKLNYATLLKFHKRGKELENDILNSTNCCKHIHTIVEALIDRCRYPRLEIWGSQGQLKKLLQISNPTCT